MTIHEIIKTVSLTAAEKQVIAKCDAKLKMLTDLEPETRLPVEHSYKCKLWDRISETADRFTTDPTHENLMAHLAVVAEIDLLTMHKEPLRELTCRAADQARASLAPVAEGIISRALVELDKQAKERRPAAESAGMLPEFEIHHDNLRMALEAERGNGSPGGWLADHGFIE